ncbi:hypothetical protein QBC35DRAFT_395048 [Podospora australis]|uniref:Transcriptional regulator n=1 Tax=Podospora australis TaxID=1536484 RepID=A0AAN6WMJ3_9PEZI|nr:hypothetical protein QBC35DRAFT_395048 [Podospora australis]
MAPKKPAEKAIVAELADAVRRIYNGPDRDNLTVNYVRQAVEEKLGFDDGFLKEGDWKAKSKDAIHSALQEAENAEPPSSLPVAPSPKPPAKRKAKADPKNGAGNRNKRAKKSPLPEPSEDELSEISEPGDNGSDSDSDLSEPIPKKRKVAKKPANKKRIVSDDEDTDPSEKNTPAKPTGKPDTKNKMPKPARVNDTSELSSIEPPALSDEDGAAKKDEDDGSELSDVIDDAPPKSKQKAKSQPKASPVTLAEEEDKGNETSSSLSSVIDDGPPTKRKSKSKDPVKKKAAASTGRKKGGAATEVSPDEAQIKTLQSQLKKCGVNKVWAFEFKKRGDDTPKAKIRRLKEALAEIGMTGRFSEARAKEIKEQRELMADVDAVQQYDQTFGLNASGRRARRAGAAKTNLRESFGSDDDDDDEDGGAKTTKSGDDEDSDEDDDGPQRARIRGPAKRRADLAFLGDESESD